MGYPYNVSHENDSEYNANVWWFRKIVKWFSEVLEEYGVRLYLIGEDYMSMECSVCGVVHESGRVFRGLYVCSATGVKVNADLNASLNIARRVGYLVRLERILSHFVAHNGVFPITLLRGKTPSGGKLAFRAWVIY